LHCPEAFAAARPLHPSVSPGRHRCKWAAPCGRTRFCPSVRFASRRIALVRARSRHPHATWARHCPALGWPLCEAALAMALTLVRARAGLGTGPAFVWSGTGPARHKVEGLDSDCYFCALPREAWVP
jgi:hypothetical protein